MIIKEELIKHNEPLYSFIKKSCTYNKNKLSDTLSEELYNGKSIDDILKTNDIDRNLLEEEYNQFILFDYVVDHIDEDITIDMLLNMHRILKNSTDGFKTKPNKIVWNPKELGEVEVHTVDPQYVVEELEKLLSKKINDIRDLTDFHLKFEHIHPFKDGNGRIGRLLLLKESIRNNLLPVIIFYENRRDYQLTITSIYANKGKKAKDLEDVLIKNQYKCLNELNKLYNLDL